MKILLKAKNGGYRKQLCDPSKKNLTRQNNKIKRPKKSESALIEISHQLANWCTRPLSDDLKEAMTL
jgi:hypothetical protein